MPPASQQLSTGSGAVSALRRGSQGPTVVLQSGLGDDMDSWAPLLPELEPRQALWAYSRPGYGDSTAATGSRDPCTVAEELHALLQRSQQRPPYLLVGHSIGGLYQYAFAKLYPQEVAGLLLIDPTHPRHWPLLQERTPALAASLKILRATAFSSAMRQEFDGQNVCLERLAALPAPVAPMTLLARSRFGLTEPEAFQRLVRELEVDWSRLLPGLQRQEVAAAGHYIHHDQPRVVNEALRRLLMPRAGRLEAARP